MTCRCGNELAKQHHLFCPECWGRLPSELREDLTMALATDFGGEWHKVSVLACVRYLKGEAVCPSI